MEARPAEWSWPIKAAAITIGLNSEKLDPVGTPVRTELRGHDALLNLLGIHYGSERAVPPFVVWESNNHYSD